MSVCLSSAIRQLKHGFGQSPSTYPLIAHKVSQSIPRTPLPLWDSDNHAKPSWPPIAVFSKHMLFLKKVYVFCFCRFEPKWFNGNMETDVQLAIFKTKFALKRWRERVRTPIIDMTTDQSDNKEHGLSKQLNKSQATTCQNITAASMFFSAASRFLYQTHTKKILIL